MKGSIVEWLLEIVTDVANSEIFWFFFSFFLIFFLVALPW